MHSFVVSGLRFGRGMYAQMTTSPPEAPLHLYEFEGCPFCRKVRDVLTELDLVFICHPCAKGSRNRAYVMEKGGKTMFPYLEDPNTGVEMYESEDIITYLMDTYGTGRTQASKSLSPLNTVSSVLAGWVRPRGFRVKKAVKSRPDPASILILYSMESSPYSRKAREVLAELDLTYEVRSCGIKSPRWKELRKRGGKAMIPYLIDPNTDVEMYESDDIMAYLRKVYGGAEIGGGLGG